MASINARSSEGLDSLHDRISQIHDSLKDLRQKIPRIDGREPDSSDSLFDTSLSSSSQSLLSPSASLSSLPIPSSGSGSRSISPSRAPGAPLAAVDPEAEEQLCSDISDRLRDIRNDYDLLVEDAQDMGWFVPADTPRQGPRSSSHRVGAWEEEDDNEDDPVPAATLHDTSSSNPQVAVERARLAKALKRTDKAITYTRREFRITRMNGLARKQYALSEKVFQELETYDEDSEVEGEDDGSEASDDGHASSDDTEYDDDAEKKHRRAHSSASGISRTPSPRQQTAEASAAAELTAALRQTHARIVGEVTRSDFAAQTLEESSRALAELGDRYSSSSTGTGDINSGLKAARSMVRGLLVAQKSDTWYLQMSLYILASTVAWLFFRRLLYGPLWLLVWWPVRSAFGTAMWVGKTGASVGAGIGGSGSSIVSVPAADVSFSSSVANVASSIVPTTSIVQANIYATEAAASSATSVSSLVEDVGRIVDEAAAGTSTGEEQAATEAPNRKKRMWEEDVEAAKFEEQQRKEKEAQDAQKAQEADAAGEPGKGKGKEAEPEKKDEL
ncbi:sec20 domain protein [Ophiostoma piceae UAMH 11346]|uniref:Sec20 domain protein n=1 Tax=Ophiostoma piceae (strain UAMH 11346) TaxID=1262450 RepID=S3C7Z4_OPHP1|nr:sec20 domain protein [Ophiostoma piceae UAMH 11346]